MVAQDSLQELLLRPEVREGKTVFLSTHVLDSATPAVAGGADREPQERSLAAYSAACADWLFVPVVDTATWTWEWFDPPTQKLALLHDAPLTPPDRR